MTKEDFDAQQKAQEFQQKIAERVANAKIKGYPQSVIDKMTEELLREYEKTREKEKEAIVNNQKQPVCENCGEAHWVGNCDKNKGYKRS